MSRMFIPAIGAKTGLNVSERRNYGYSIRSFTEPDENLERRKLYNEERKRYEERFGPIEPVFSFHWNGQGARETPGDLSPLRQIDILDEADLEYLVHRDVYAVVDPDTIQNLWSQDDPSRDYESPPIPAFLRSVPPAFHHSMLNDYSQSSGSRFGKESDSDEVEIIEVEDSMPSEDQSATDPMELETDLNALMVRSNDPPLNNSATKMGALRLKKKRPPPKRKAPKKKTSKRAVVPQADSYFCPVPDCPCSTVFDLEGVIEHVVLFHKETNGGKTVCPIPECISANCNVVLSNSKFRRHLQYDYGVRYYCDLCEKKRSFVRKEELKRHVDDTHKNLGKFKCPRCIDGAKYSRKTLGNHIKESHDEEKAALARLVHQETGKKIYLDSEVTYDLFECPLCVKTYDSKSRVSRHFRKAHPSSLVRFPQFKDTD